MTTRSISWLELIELMAMGPADGRADTVRGLVHTRDTWQVYGEVPEDQDTVERLTLGVLGVAESTVHVLRKGDLVRLERPTGDVTAIFGADTRRVRPRITGASTKANWPSVPSGWPSTVSRCRRCPPSPCSCTSAMTGRARST